MTDKYFNEQLKKRPCFCEFCNQPVYPGDDFDASKTKRGSLIFSHKKCTKIYSQLFEAVK